VKANKIRIIINRHLNELMQFVKSLKKNSLGFALYEAKEFRNKGNFNKAMLVVSELIRDHITCLQYIQRLFDEIRGNAERKIVFQKFSQWEPLEVGLSNAPDVFRIIDEFLVPWKRENSNLVRDYLDLEKRLDYEKKKTDAFERFTSTDGSSSELEVQYEILFELSEKIEIFQYELSVAIIYIAEKILKKMSPILNNGDKVKYLSKLSNHSGTLIQSPIVSKHADYVDAENN